MPNSATNFIYEHEGIKCAFSAVTGTGGQHAFTPGIVDETTWDLTAMVPFQLAVAGLAHGGLPAVATAATDLPKQMRLVSHNLDSKGLRLTYAHDELGIEVDVELSGVPGSQVIRCVTTARNVSNQPVVLTHLSSALLQGIAVDGIRPWHDREKVCVHYARQTWAGEGQWRSGSLEELGLYGTAKHSTRAAVHISSEGSWSTSRYAPVVVIEDRETSQSWYAQIETSSPWHFEIGVRGSLWDTGKRALYLQADGASERVGGWSHELLPGESFTSVPVAVGCCHGDFTDAIRELTKYRRAALRLGVPQFGQAPLVFNDYMNCLFAQPTREKLVPLIDAAAEAGVEVYCIDSGWFTSPNTSGKRILGDWVPKDELFGDGGLRGILQYMRDRGLVPGIWLEIEVCGEDAVVGQQPDDWFLRIRGKRVGGGDRWFFNFTNAEVKAYLHGKIDSLVELGVGYIKNDYNACVGLGDDVLGSSPADGLLRNERAFYRFIDEVRERHPQLILENCSCGAMRTDYGAGAHFHLASYSDQENYLLAPSILGGSLACILPEQLGIWAYPFPLEIADINHPEKLQSTEYLEEQADGEQTIFNMVNGLCGVPYLSGRIDLADETNFALIQEATRLAREERQFIASAFPVWPTGHHLIGDVDKWASIGLLSEDADRLLLAVWRRETSSSYCEIPLRGFAGSKCTVRQIYPVRTADVRSNLNPVKGILTVEFPQMNQARLFEVQKVW